ncbi:hypothetical protein LDENG_00296160 [Lucifuga dentata]|nr:hypothetical protein LDENG_00296160 [Lucifuga dentata]
MEATVSRVPLPLPAHFSHAEQSFSLKKRRLPFSSSCTSTSSFSSSLCLSRSLPPLPPSKGCPPLSRMFMQQPSPWTPLSRSLNKSSPPPSVYDPSKQQSYFSQCFTNLGLLGRGSFGEVYKVLSHEDSRHYAVKRSAHRFRGNSERNRSVKEARNHERLCPHPHILNFVAAWEECGRLYIQTELCSTSLLLHAENQPPGPGEAAAWMYLCDLLLALQHLHSCGFVHLDLKPANVLVTESGRLKLGDFGLLLELKQKCAGPAEGKVKEDLQEGDARYMAPELLRGQYGPAADVFSLGVSILELACNIEVPNGGEGWQQLRQGWLPSEFTSTLSAELQTVLRMMLAPKPTERATVSELLSLPSVRKHVWKRRIYLLFTEAMLMLASLFQLVVCFGWRLLSSLHLPFLPQWTKPVPCTPPKDSWEKDLTLPLSTMHADSSSPEDDAVFVLDPTNQELSPTFSHRINSRLSVESTSTPLPASPTHSHLSPAHTRTGSDNGEWPSNNLTHTPSSIHSNSSCRTLAPGMSPIHKDPHTESLCDFSMHSQRSSSSKSSQRRSRNWVRPEEALPRNFEPKNLLSLFEETALEGQSLKSTREMSKIERLNARVAKLLSKAVQEVLEVVRETVWEYQEKTARTQRENQSLKRRLQELQDKINAESNRIVPHISPASHQAEVELEPTEQKQKEELKEDMELISSNEHSTEICPSNSYDDLVCEAPITLVVCFGWRLLSFLHLPFLPQWTKPVPCTPPKDSWERDLTLPLSTMHADSSSPEDDAVFVLDPTDQELSPNFSHRWRIRCICVVSSALHPNLKGQP